LVLATSQREVAWADRAVVRAEVEGMT
jgi:hypothetical protein